MDDLGGLLAGNYGLRPQGKSAPMSASKPSPNIPSRSADSWLNDDLLANHGRSSAKPANSILDGFENLGTNASMPVFDKPLYDDDDNDMFDGVPGMRSSSTASVPFDVFESLSTGSNRSRSPKYDDLLENLGRGTSGQEKRSGERKKQDSSAFDDLIPGFGGSGIPKKRESPEINQPSFTTSSGKPTADMAEDPFIVLESASTSGTSSSGKYTDPLEHMSRDVNSGSNKVENSSASRGTSYETDSFGGLQNSIPTFKTDMNQNMREKNHSDDAQNINNRHQFSGKEPSHQFSPDVFEDILPKMQPHKSNTDKTSGRNDFHSSEMYGRNAMGDQSPKFNEHFDTANDVWLTVSEIPLFTQLTSAPPPSRPPPPLVSKHNSFGANGRLKNNESFSQSSHSHYNARDSMHKPVVSSIDELEDFAMGKPQNAQDRAGNMSNEEEFEANLAAAAMKEAMDRAEAKFKHAKEVRERQAKSKEYMQQEHDEKTKVDDHDFEDKEYQEKLVREQEQKQREEREKELKRMQREREMELERERAKQAVDRATREARERLAVEARQKAEKAAAEKAAAEARQRAERAAVQRAAAEARERAAAEARARVAAEAREKAAREKAAAEARERAEREKSERAAAERVAAEARIRTERAAAEARERAAAAARERQQKPDDDLESFFGMGARATSAPKTRSPTVESMFETQNKGSYDGPRRTSSTTSSNIKKTSSATNFVDDLSSIFGGPPSSEEFQEIEGETEERRRARLERHQRTRERAAKALAEKNERDMQTQREQAERHRIGETLDFEIKRWAAGKEGNLRALLSTMQYVLWPECGWQPVSLTDLITAASVKKVYRKANLCIHPDKVQQKGATLQQKYIAEKVFDLLKEAWNKFNSEELF